MVALYRGRPSATCRPARAATGRPGQPGSGHEHRSPFTVNVSPSRWHPRRSTTVHSERCRRSRETGPGPVRRGPGAVPEPFTVNASPDSAARPRGPGDGAASAANAAVWCATHQASSAPTGRGTIGAPCPPGRPRWWPGVLRATTGRKPGRRRGGTGGPANRSTGGPRDRPRGRKRRNTQITSTQQVGGAIPDWG